MQIPGGSWSDPPRPQLDPRWILNRSQPPRDPPAALGVLRRFLAFPQLFLDDTKVKNFITCFKDVRFLAFFFKQLQPNRSGHYETQFPFVSLCGRERNFLRCDDRPVVFTEILPGTGADTERLLSYCGAGDRLTIPFQPQNLVVSPRNGRLYHPAPTRVGGVGLVRSALALEWDPCFEYELGPAQPPTHFNWEGQRYRLTGELLPLLHGGESADVTVTPCQG